MTEQEFRNRLMDYLYDEMDEKQKTEFKAYLDKNPDLRNELDELRGIRKALEHTPKESPAHKLITVADERQSHPRESKSKNPYLLPALAVAASVLITALIFLFTNIQFGQTDDGFYMAIGNHPVPQEAVTKEMLVDLMDQIRNENALLMASLLNEAREQQNAQLEQVLIELTNYYDQRREQDLYLIAEGLTQLEEETAYRFIRTNQTLGDLIYTLNNP